MIAKRIDTKSANPRIARLVKYVVAAQGGLDPRSWSRTADYMLNSGTSNRGEKVGGVRVTNCHTDDPAAATALIECTQAANTRSKSDKTYHLVFAFPPGEEPDLKTLHKIEDELVASIGYTDHQRISAVHIDTDHLHVHVAINKVHPKGFQNIEPYYDKKKLMETCERLELEYGLTRTNHGLTGERKREKGNSKRLPDINRVRDDLRSKGSGEIRSNERNGSLNEKTTGAKNRAADLEAHSGIESLQGFVTRELGGKLKEAKKWKDAHGILAEHGLEIKLRGAGMVIGSGEVWIKASTCDRELSFKALTDKLGPFEKGSKQTKKTTKAYEPKPKQQHPSSAALYDQYQNVRLQRQAVREKVIKQIRYESDMAEYNLKKWRVAQRLIIKAGIKGPSRRAMFKVVTLQTALKRNANRKAINKRRAEAMATIRMPSWPQWLAEQTECGNTDALALLRSREEREKMQGDYLTAENTSNAYTVPRLEPKADKNGALTYKCADGGIVIDRKNYVQSFKTTAGAAQLALELAAQRFKGQTLIVEGSEEFKNEVAKLAKLHVIDVRFVIPEKERIRKGAMPMVSNKRQQSKTKEVGL